MDPNWKPNLQQRLTEAWDYVIMTDGSATRWHLPGGWAAEIVDQHGVVEHICGGSNHATNIYAEINGWWQALTYIHSQEKHKDQARRWRETSSMLRIMVLSDNQYVVQTGNAVHAGSELNNETHAAYWWGLKGLRASGIWVEFLWVPRETIPGQHRAHTLANTCRKLMMSPGVPNSPAPPKEQAEV